MNREDKDELGAFAVTLAFITFILILATILVTLLI